MVSILSLRVLLESRQTDLWTGPTAGQAIAEHMEIEKVAFTGMDLHSAIHSGDLVNLVAPAGSTLVGRKVLEAAAKSNLKGLI